MTAVPVTTVLVSVNSLLGSARRRKWSLNDPRPAVSSPDSEGVY